MDAITLRWMIVGELVVTVLFGALLLRPGDAWVSWRPLMGFALAVFVLVPLGVGFYLERRDRKLRSSRPVNQVERT